MNFIFAILNDRTLRRLRIETEVMDEIIQMIDEKKVNFIGNDITEIGFEGGYKPNEDEVFTIQMTLDDGFNAIPDNTQEIQELSLPEDRIKILGFYKNGDYYFQCFQNRYVLTKNRMVISFSGDTYKKFNDEKALMINDDIHALYHEGKLYFRKFNLAKQIFDLTQFYTEATNNDIESTIGNDLFLGSDCEWMKANSDTVMRKLIKSIEASGVMGDIHPDTREFKRWLTKANINPNIIQNGHIVLPPNKKQCKQILAFINEDIYEGIFSHNIFKSNSKHRNN